MATTYGNFQQEVQNRGSFLNSRPHQTSGTLHYFPGTFQPRVCPTTNNDYKQQAPGSFSQQNYAMFSTGQSTKKESLVLAAESIDDDLLTRLCYAMGLDKLYHLPELNRLTDFLDGM